MDSATACPYDPDLLASDRIEESRLLYRARRRTAGELR
jgi:hypothetical protein